MRRFSRRAVLIMLLLTPLALAGARAVQAQAVQPLRDVDWRAVLASEPGVSLGDDPLCSDAVNQSGQNGQNGACVSVHIPDLRVTHIALPGESQLGEIDSVSGNAMTGPGGPLYGDLDGDGRDEAVISVFNDRAFTVAYFVYREAPGRPQLVDAAPGYRMAVALQNGALLVTRPYYFGAPTVLGPTGSSTTTYRMQNNLLRPVAPFSTFVAEPFTADSQQSSVSSYPELIVWGFYRALAQRRFEAAYAFFSPSMQARTPFAAWRDGYASTVSFTLQTTYVPDPNNQGGDTFGSPDVLITLTAVDAQPGGGTVTRVFTGSWTLVEDQSPQWGLALDHANLRLVP